MAPRPASEASDERQLIWSRDGSRVAFNARRGSDRLDLYQKAGSGESSEELLLEDDHNKWPESWSPDGRLLLFSKIVNENSDLAVLPLFGDRRTFPFVETRFNEAAGVFSPDGRWVAYQSNRSGREEVYVAPFPGPGTAVPVSTGGGGWPRWRRRDGRELLYVAPDNRLMAVAVNGQGSEFEIGVVQPLFEMRRAGGPLRALFDVTADGQRFLVNSWVEDREADTITLVVNWASGLRERR